METILYHYWRSSASWRVRWALAVKGIEFRSVPVDIVNGEQLSAEHRARNPMTHVPALWIEGRSLAESVAIFEYLEEMNPMPPLYPAEPWARARVRQVVELVNSAIQPLQNLVTLARHSSDKVEQRQWARFFNERGLEALEALLGQIAEEIPNGDGFAVGKTLTAADLFITPQVSAARRFGVEVERYPRVLASEQAALATEHAAGALPENQPGAPDKPVEPPTPPPAKKPAEVLTKTVEVPAPTIEVPAPAIENEAPAIEVPAPAIEVPAPAIEDEAPAIEVPAPAIEVPAPAIEVPAPAIEDQAPAIEDQAPAIEVPAPAIEVPAPTNDQRAAFVDQLPTPPEPAPPPIIEHLAPAYGPLAGGVAVLIRGTGFAEGVRVFFGGAEATVERLADTLVRAEAPARAAKGAVELRVENPDGQDDGRARAFRYEPSPVLVGIEPATVPLRGGAVVTFLGSEFAESCVVLIDGHAVPFARVHAGRLEAVVSPRAAGVVDVEVQNPDGQTVRLAGALRYAEPPQIDAISPRRGYTSGGAEVVIRGRGFEPGSAVLFAREPIASVTVVSDTEILAVSPRHEVPEIVSIAVVSPAGLTCHVAGAYTYEISPPRIATVSPASGSNAGGTRMTITGTDFDERAEVFVCGLKAPATWKSREELEALTPAVARDGLVDVRVVNEDDQAAVAEKVFRYDAPLAAPSLAALTPARGPGGGGVKVSVSGDDFAEGAVVRFGVLTAETRFLNRKQLEATLPPVAGAAEVTVDVTVVNPDGVIAALESAFTYEARPMPQITGVTPAFGPTTGGTKVVLEGANFTPDCVVYVGREYAKDLAVKSATEIHILTAPRKTAGVVDVEIAAPGLPRAVAKNGFRYDAIPAPEIKHISPTVGGTGGGTEMVITGKNFRKDTAVLIDGKAVKTVKLVDAQTLEVKTPPGEPNKMVDVIVRNADGKEALQKRAFMYDPRYRG
jgi:maleylacetoacetate isomerase